MPRGTKRTAANLKNKAEGRSASMSSNHRSVKNRGRHNSESNQDVQIPPTIPLTPNIRTIPPVNSDIIISPRTQLVENLSTFHLQENKKIKTDNEPVERMEVDNEIADLLGNFNLLPEGRIHVVGQGSTGQLGIGPDIIERKKPYPVKSLVDIPIKVIASGGMHTACISSSHEIFTFGCNDEGALGRTCADDDDETVPKTVTLPKEAGKPVCITAGDSHCAILDELGQVFVWGNFRDGSGQLGLTSTEKGKSVNPVKLDIDEKIKKICSGADHLVLLAVTGLAYTFGSGGVGQLGRGGRYFSDRGGRRGTEFQLKPTPVRFSVPRKSKLSQNYENIPPPKSPKPSGGGTTVQSRYFIDDIFAGGLCSFLVCQNKVYSFGLNNYSQLGLGESDKENRFVPSFSAEFSTKSWAQIVGGEHHCIGLDKNNDVYAVGRGDDGRLGILDQNGEPFTETGILHKINLPNTPERYCTSISSTNTIAYAGMNDGTGYAWGFGGNLQLTTGDDDCENTPIELQGGRIEGKFLLQVATGGQHGCFLIKIDDEES